MIVTLEEAKAHLRVDQDDDDVLLADKILAAEAHVDRLLGFVVAETYGGEDQDPVPPPLKEAVLQLAGAWYGQREATIAEISVKEVPLSVADIVREYRQWSF